MEVNYNYYLVTYFAIVNCITAQILDPVTQEEIFGSGQSSKNNPVRNKEGCNRGHGLSVAIKLGTPEPNFLQSGLKLTCSKAKPLFGT